MIIHVKFFIAKKFAHVPQMIRFCYYADVRREFPKEYPPLVVTVKQKFMNHLSATGLYINNLLIFSCRVKFLHVYLRHLKYTEY